MERLHEAAIQAEFETGRTEDSEAKARRGVVMRMVTIVGGFLVVGIGIAAIPLPGPGWLIVFVGLTLLSREFDWAARWVEIVRRRAKIDELREKPIGVQIAVALVGLVFMGAAIYWSLRKYL